MLAFDQKDVSKTKSMKKDNPKCPECKKKFEIEGCICIFSSFVWKRFDFPQQACNKCGLVYYGNESELRKETAKEITIISGKKKQKAIKEIFDRLYKNTEDFRGRRIIRNL